VVRSIEPSRNVVLVHGCRATGEDVALISDHFKDNVTWALCPESNRYISNDQPPVELLRKMGCRIGIGTDSLASARSLSLVDNLRLIDDVPLDEALTWATKGGAEALGMEHLGEIAVGKRPGLVIIRDADLHNLRLTPESRAERVV
jgi:cytosine/adenosine deaminase-related metal-dependent hydrolase